MVDITPDETLDCRGLSCPMPVLKTKKALAALASGKVLEVMATDPGTGNDMPKTAKKNNGEYLGNKDGDGYTSYYIKKN